MLKISGTNIAITRGDSGYITLGITDNKGRKYSLEDGDEIKVQVRTSPNNGDLLFQGTIEYDEDNDECIWHILPNDTHHAEVSTYYYDAQLHLSNGDIFTFIPSSKFKLLDEVTCNERYR